MSQTEPSWSEQVLVVQVLPEPVLVEPEPERRQPPAHRVFQDWKAAQEYMHAEGGAMRDNGGGRRYKCRDPLCDGRAVVMECTSGGFHVQYSVPHLVSCTSLALAPFKLQPSQVKVLHENCVNTPRKIQEMVPAMREGQCISKTRAKNRAFLARKAEQEATVGTVDDLIEKYINRKQDDPLWRDDIRQDCVSWDVPEDQPMSIERSHGVATVTSVALMKLADRAIRSGTMLQGGLVHSSELSLDGTFSFCPLASCYLTLGVMVKKTFVPVFVAISRAQGTKGFESTAHIKALLKSATKLMSVHGFTCLDDFKGTVIIDAGKGLQKGVMEFMPNCCIADCFFHFRQALKTHRPEWDEVHEQVLEWTAEIHYCSTDDEFVEGWGLMMATFREWPAAAGFVKWAEKSEYAPGGLNCGWTFAHTTPAANTTNSAIESFNHRMHNILAEHALGSNPSFAQALQTLPLVVSKITRAVTTTIESSVPPTSQWFEHSVVDSKRISHHIASDALYIVGLLDETYHVKDTYYLWCSGKSAAKAISKEQYTRYMGEAHDSLICWMRSRHVVRFTYNKCSCHCFHDIANCCHVVAMSGRRHSNVAAPVVSAPMFAPLRPSPPRPTPPRGSQQSQRHIANDEDGTVLGFSVPGPSGKRLRGPDASGDGMRLRSQQERNGPFAVVKKHEKEEDSD